MTTDEQKAVWKARMESDPEFRAAVLYRMADPSDLKPIRVAEPSSDTQKAAKRLGELMHEQGLV